MSIQVQERVSGDTALTNTLDDPVGIAPERVDSYTLTVVHQLFPSPTCGAEFLALLLRLARVKQLSLTIEQQELLASVAVISVQSIKQLAKLIGWSYESTHKYVVLFCALGLLIKRRNRGMVELHFPLHRYAPPTLDALDKLIERYQQPKRRGKTDKRLKHAERVKQRFLLLYGAQALAALPPAPGVPDACTTLSVPNLAEAIGEVTDLLSQIPENLPYNAHLASILQKLEQAQEQLVGIHSTLPPGAATPGRFSAPVVDSSVAVATRKGRFAANVVDSVSPSSAISGRFSDEQVDSFASPQDHQEASTSQKSTHDVSASAQMGRFSASQGAISAKKVDSDPALSSNVNVITLIESITLNVSMVALFCCNVLGEAPGKRGIYCKLFREVDSDVQAITAALVYTLVHREDGTIRKPPAVFIRRCRDYHREGVPEEAVTLVQRYGQLPYTQLLEALRRKASPIVQSVSSGLHQAPVPSARSTFSPLSTLLTAVPARIPLKRDGGMTCEDAQRLYSRIAHDRLVLLCRTGLTRLADGTYAVLVDNTITEKVNQVAFYSAHEWQIRSAHITNINTLFAPEGQTSPRPLQALLKKRGTL